MAQSIINSVQSECFHTRDGIGVYGHKRVGYGVQDDLLSIGRNLDRGSLAEGGRIAEVRRSAVQVNSGRAGAINDSERTVVYNLECRSIGHEGEESCRLVLCGGGYQRRYSSQ